MSSIDEFSGIFLPNQNFMGEQKKVCSSARKILEDIFSNLPLECRMVFLMREINGFSSEETALLLDIDERKMEVLLDESKNMIISELRKNCAFERLFKLDPEHCDAMVVRIMNLINNINKKQL